MIQEIKDRIPTKVLPNNAIRYGIYDEKGNLQRYEYIKREDEPLEEGTPINKILLDELREMNNYELMTVSQEDVSTITTASTITQQLTSAETGHTWNGYMEGKQDIEEWPFKIESDGITPLTLSSNWSTSYINIWCSYSGTASSDFTKLNSCIKRKTYNKDYGVYYNSKAKAKCYLVWDFLRENTPTFNYRMVKSGTAPSAIFQGSNNGVDWVTLNSNLSLDNVDNQFTPSTAYRYFRVEITINGTSNDYSGLYFYYMYFTNTSDKIVKLRNNFTVDNDFTQMQCKNVIVPEYENAEYVTENNINGLSFNKVLQVGEYCKLRYNGENLEYNDNTRCVRGTYTGLGINSEVVINLGFKPKFLLVFTNPESTSRTMIGFIAGELGSYVLPQQGGSSSALYPTYVSGYGNLILTSTGFKGTTASTGSVGFSGSGITYNYIAIM